MKLEIKALGVFALLCLGVGCDAAKTGVNPQKSISGGSSQPALGLYSSAKLCGMHMSVNQATAGGNPRPMTALAAAEICGTQGTKTATWHALGMQVSTAQVYLKKAGTSTYDTSPANEADIVISATNDVMARQGARLIKIGTAANAGHAAPILLAPGAVVEITVKTTDGERPYVIGDKRSTPDADKHLFVTTQD